jgi:hypothetical protein
MKSIFIVPIEPIDQRYTKQWYENIPQILSEEIEKRELNISVFTIDGATLQTGTTKGAFLDFGATNVYKAVQVQTIANMFTSGLVTAGDSFLVTDAWNFVVTAIRYMSDLLEIPVEIHSIWHAGNYDPTDILGMKMKRDWAANQERAWYYASDYNYYATYFHRTMFLRNLKISDKSKAFRSGQPHTPIIANLSKYFDEKKSDIIMFPHRYNSDKQPEIAEDLAKTVIGEMRITQKMNLSKEEYYAMLGKAKVVFSCSLHENLGISMMEGVMAGAIPIVPNRASYTEMYLEDFVYPSKWTSSIENYNKHKQQLLDFINERVVNYHKYQDTLKMQRQSLIDLYMSPTVMVNNLLKV